ncbi:MAG: hypothetical protein RIG77_10565 [Cyclobacteriaceae bacterium]
MRRKEKNIGQYSFETKNLNDDIDEFLDSVAPEIGYLIFDFNSLEESLTSLLCKMINDRADSTGLILTSGMSYSSKVNLLNRYMEHGQLLAGREIEGYDNFIGEMKECGTLRNMVVHAEWETADIDGYTLIKVKVKKGELIQEYVQFDLESLTKIRNRINSLTNKISEYEHKYFDLMGN